MLKIWGRANSINVQKALFCLEEIGLDYERIDAGLEFGVNDTPDYLAMNPNGRIPTIDDDGFILWEANAIVRYLGNKYGRGDLYPSDPAHLADADRWMDWQATMLFPALLPAFLGLVRTEESKRNEASIARSCTATANYVAILDNHLAGRPYLTGETFTIGDIAVAAAIHRWLHLPTDTPQADNVQAWYDRIMTRPAAKKTLLLPIT